MKNNRISLFGLLSATFFIGMFAGAYHFNAQSAAQNAANSGEGGIILILYAMPWIMLIPSSVANSFGSFALFLLVGLNAVLIYLFMGGAFALLKNKVLTSRSRPTEVTPKK